MNIVVLDGFAANPGDLSWDDIEALGSLTVYERSSPQEVIERIGNAEIILVNKVAITPAVMDACPNLRLICETATGFNNIDIGAAKARGIAVANVPAYSTASVAQMVFAFLLEIAQRVVAHSDAVHAGRWSSAKDFCFRDHPLFELEGKTLGIVGYGTIGQRVAKIATAFGMQVLACSRTYRPELSTDHIKIVSQEQVLSSSDIITLHCPENEESRHLICAQTLAQMKKGAILINTARGGCVVEEDVRAALESGQLSWYAADVLSTEPPAPSNPLLGAPNCMITPHIAWMTTQARCRLLETTAQNIAAFLQGNPIHIVNP